ncbi:hypothetical protein RHOSPDRAFT_26620 [Rhodotorula sp. JG-1b]|nr:hypothetical protein RHOSPDRAFT_26620 [Rhodotorula sp. JG-1b]
MSAVSAEQARPVEWSVCGIPEGGLLIFTKDSDIKTKDGQQLKYHGSVKPRGEWTPRMKQAFEQYAEVLEHTARKLKDLTARSVAKKYPDWFQPDPYKLGNFFVKAVSETASIQSAWVTVQNTAVEVVSIFLHLCQTLQISHCLSRSWVELQALATSRCKRLKAWVQPRAQLALAGSQGL